jgi:group I intron endonuclease
MKICGIYSITNRVNGKKYIGSSHNIKTRWHQHRTLLRQGKHGNSHLQYAWDKYGEESFEFVILLECQPDELIDNEQSHIDTLSPEYNIVPFARTGRGNLGRLRPDNIERNKTFRSKGHTGCLHSPETKAKMAAAWVERKKVGFSDETRAKMSIASTGRRLSPEHKAKLRIWLVGHEVTAEMREKSAAKQRGVKLSPERIQLSIDGRKAARLKREAENGL